MLPLEADDGFYFLMLLFIHVEYFTVIIFVWIIVNNLLVEAWKSQDHSTE